MNPPSAPAPAFLEGIDVSHFQDTVDWPAVARSGAAFCFIKATEGSSLVDRQFVVNWAGAAKAGIVRGTYHFFHPAISVTAQADLFLRTISALEPGDLPPVLDLEAPEQWAAIPAPGRATLALKWLQIVQERVHLVPILYLNASFISDVLHNASELAPYPLWLAQYTTGPAPGVPKPWNKWTFWQYSQQGSRPGVSGSVDLNRFNGTLDELKTLAMAPPTGEKLPA